MEYQMSLDTEIIVDNFAGGGGASCGIEQALQRPVNIAINHDKEAISMHEANHPLTEHFCEDVWDINPLEVCKGRPIGLAWFSPDCKHFSRAKGGKPVEKKIRGLAWVVLKWAKLPLKIRPRIIALENVGEFLTWGPLLENGQPDPAQKGKTFNVFVNALKKHGYTVEWRELKACDYGAPTIRKRLFLIARRDNMPIIWPKPTHGEGLLPYETAASCIDWSIPCPSIFERKRPLAENTLKRIAKGIQKFLIDADEPFIVKVNHGGNDIFRGQSINDPLQTITQKNGYALVNPFIQHVQHASSNNGTMPADEPLRTITAHPKGGGMALISASIQSQYGTSIGRSLDSPLPTTTAVNKSSLLAAFLIKYYGNEKEAADLDKPLGTVTTKDRFGLVTIRGEKYKIVDIGLRMLAPRELYRTQGFPDDYIIDKTVDGKPLTKKAQVRMCGNSVCPPLSKAIIEANMKQSSLFVEQQSVRCYND